MEDPLYSCLVTPATAHSPDLAIKYSQTIIGYVQLQLLQQNRQLMDRENFPGEEMMKYEIFLSGKLRWNIADSSTEVKKSYLQQACLEGGVLLLYAISWIIYWMIFMFEAAPPTSLGWDPTSLIWSSRGIKARSLNSNLMARK